MSDTTRIHWLAPILALIIGSAAAIALGLARTPVAQGATPRYVATTGSDAGACADNMSPCRTIGYTIGQALAGDTIVIATGVYTEHLTIDKQLSFSGASASATIIDGGQQGSVLIIDTMASVKITGVTIRNGGSTVTGGGIDNRGTLVLLSSVVSGNTSTAMGALEPVPVVAGGGIDNRGTLVLLSSVVSGNTTSAPYPATVGAVMGGGIDNHGILVLNGSVISGNTSVSSDAGPFGGGIYNAGTLIMDTSVVSGNTSAGGGGGGQFGGGIYNAGTLIMDTSVVSGNAVQGYVGGPTEGGGIYNTGIAHAAVSNSVIANNRANALIAQGGGIRNIGAMELTGSTVSANSVFGRVGEGGGIRNTGTLTLTNSTIDGNAAAGSGSAGGGIYNSGTLSALNSTITQNIAENAPDSRGGGVYNDGTFKIRNTILARNLSIGKGNDCWGRLASEGHNLLGEAAGCSGVANGVNHDRAGTSSDPIDPRLGPLRSNGGPTQTRALLLGSLAIDAGDGSACPATDQRGISRPLDGDGNDIAICDIGAFETETLPPAHLFLPWIVARR